MTKIITGSGSSYQYSIYWNSDHNDAMLEILILISKLVSCYDHTMSSVIYLEKGSCVLFKDIHCRET